MCETQPICVRESYCLFSVIGLAGLELELGLGRIRVGVTVRPLWLTPTIMQSDGRNSSIRNCMCQKRHILYINCRLGEKVSGYEWPTHMVKG